MLLFLSVAVCDVIDETHTTVGSHLFELQLSKYIGYPNAFSKVTSTISSYFCRREARFSFLNGQYQVFQGSLYPLYGS